MTGTVKVNDSSSFVMQLEVEGDTDELTLIWSNVMGNPSFGFTPTSVIDNGVNDNDPPAKKVKPLFTIIAPEIPGSYSFQVFAAGRGGKGDSLTIQVTVTSPTSNGTSVENLLPTAYFLYSRNQMTIEFDDRSVDSDGNITYWFWDFGDTTNSTEQNSTHTYVEFGTYTVTLTVTDDEGGSHTAYETFTLPTQGERMRFWSLQIFLGSLVIIITVASGDGIATRKKKGENSRVPTTGNKLEKKPEQPSLRTSLVDLVGGFDRG